MSEGKLKLESLIAGSNLYCLFDDEMIARMDRDTREDDAYLLPRQLTYGSKRKCDLKQENTCIWSDGTLSWMEALHGIMWVAVHGMDSICVVTRIKDLEQEITLRSALFKENKPESLLNIFTNGLIGKVEGASRRISDFVDPSRRGFSDQIIKKPFGVVSVIPNTKIVGTVNGPKLSSVEYDEENAIKFLQNEMESGAAFTYDKTVQTAIRALDHLFRREFKDNEMQAFVWKKDGGKAKTLPHFHKELDVEEHLAAIDMPDSCVSEGLDSCVSEVLDIEEFSTAFNKPCSREVLDIEEFSTAFNKPCSREDLDIEEHLAAMIAVYVRTLTSRSIQCHTVE